MTVFNHLRLWLIQTRPIKRALSKPADLNIFREKPSARFILGMGLVGFSYLMTWPFIAVLSIGALLLSWPALFLIGSPLAYVFSHLIFLAGLAIAGKDSIRYIHAFNRWLLYRIAVLITPHQQ